MGVIDGDEPVSKNEWEQLKKTAGGVQKWINENMRYRSCVIVLVGAQTSGRPWVQYEIKKAWNEGKGLFGIYIHNLNDPNTGTSNRGLDPFSQFALKKTDGSSVRIPVYDPISNNAYNEIKNNINHWSEIALVATDNRQPLI
jgi:Thoeris protein ThsB, TIR-like domain